MELSPSFYQNRKLENLVENRTIYTLSHAELNIFETYKQASQVALRFDAPVLASMIKGKKVMHLADSHPFDFLPGESVILPPGELMCIDFPEASQLSPTQCLAMTFADLKLKEILERLNETSPRLNGKEWTMNDYNFHFTNDIAIHQILQRLIFLFTEQHPSKDLFADFLIQELIIRIIQTESKSMYLKRAELDASHDRLAFIIQYIRDHIREDLTIERLSEKAYMSTSHFYRTFKNEIGSSPNDFIIEERLKIAESKLKDPRSTVKEVYLESGFNSFSYFCRIFKKKKKVSPGEYKEKAQRLHVG
ncbi:MAG: AraC family transcriptional regulator [Spirosomataceae bacterium]